MSPFGGDGVNNDMLNVTDLAKMLVESASWKGAVWECEKCTFNRIISSAAGAAQAAATLLSHDGQVLTLEMFCSHHATSAQSKE